MEKNYRVINYPQVDREDAEKRMERLDGENQCIMMVSYILYELIDMIEVTVNPIQDDQTPIKYTLSYIPSEEFFSENSTDEEKAIFIFNKVKEQSQELDFVSQEKGMLKALEEIDEIHYMPINPIVHSIGNVDTENVFMFPIKKYFSHSPAHSPSIKTLPIMYNTLRNWGYLNADGNLITTYIKNEDVLYRVVYMIIRGDNSMILVTRNNCDIYTCILDKLPSGTRTVKDYDISIHSILDTDIVDGILMEANRDPSIIGFVGTSDLYRSHTDFPTILRLAERCENIRFSRDKWGIGIYVACRAERNILLDDGTSAAFNVEKGSMYEIPRYLQMMDDVNKEIYTYRPTNEDLFATDWYVIN